MSSSALSSSEWTILGKQSYPVGATKMWMQRGDMALGLSLAIVMALSGLSAGNLVVNEYWDGSAERKADLVMKRWPLFMDFSVRSFETCRDTHIVSLFTSEPMNDWWDLKFQIQPQVFPWSAGDAPLFPSHLFGSGLKASHLYQTLNLDLRFEPNLPCRRWTKTLSTKLFWRNLPCSSESPRPPWKDGLSVCWRTARLHDSRIQGDSRVP